ncbi:uncharacterized protein LOC144107293 [Amblyomma americanum]
MEQRCKIHPFSVRFQCTSEKETQAAEKNSLPGAPRLPDWTGAPCRCQVRKAELPQDWAYGCTCPAGRCVKEAITPLVAAEMFARKGHTADEPEALEPRRVGGFGAQLRPENPIPAVSRALEVAERQGLLVTSRDQQ